MPHDASAAGVAPLELPIGEEAAFNGIADLLTDRGVQSTPTAHRPWARSPTTWKRKSTRCTTTSSRASSSPTTPCSSVTSTVTCRAWRSSSTRWPLASDDASVFPVRVRVGVTERVGIDRLADFICEIGPSPLDRPPAEVHAGESTVTVRPDADGRGAVGVRVQDRRRPLCRPPLDLQGALGNRGNPTTTCPTPGRRPTNGCTDCSPSAGREHLDVGAIPAGDLGAVAKLTAHAAPVRHAPHPRASPSVISGAVEWPEPVLWPSPCAPRHRRTRTNWRTALHRLTDEDPTLVIERNDETHGTLLKGMGETHLAHHPREARGASSV